MDRSKTDPKLRKKLEAAWMKAAGAPPILTHRTGEDGDVGYWIDVASFYRVCHVLAGGGAEVPE